VGVVRMKKILVVDDDHNILEVIEGYLNEHEDFQTKTCDSAIKAVEVLKQEEFDLVITDVIMPDMNGLELTEYIYQNFPQIKILACSGGGVAGRVVAGLALDQALEEGATNAILKPFSEEELMTKVRNLLEE
jgi:CheY-like chemotaxis protein